MATTISKTGKSKKIKTCYIVRRYFIKSNGSVCCVVRNEQGKEYTTCVHADGRTSCTCETYNGKCYHRDFVVAQENAREAVAQAEEIVNLPTTCPIVAPELSNECPAAADSKLYWTVDAYNHPIKLRWDEMSTAQRDMQVQAERRAQFEIEFMSDGYNLYP